MISRSEVENTNGKRSTPLRRNSILESGFLLQVNTLKFVTVLLAGAFTLLTLNLVTIYLDKVQGMESSVVKAMVYYFDASREQSVPTLFSSLLLFISSILLLAIYFLHSGSSRRNNRWLLLSIVFFFLLVDEAAGIHEQFNRFRGYFSDSSGYLYYAWIIPYGVLVILFSLVMFRFIVSLPTRIRNMIILAGIIYVSAAIGFEIFEGRSTKEDGVGNIHDKLLTATEEFLEMLGIIIFIHALFRYMAASNFSILIAPEPTEERNSTAMPQSSK